MRVWALGGMMFLTLTGGCVSEAKQPGKGLTTRGPWLVKDGQAFVPVGDSVTQGWFESGANFDHEGYLDAIAAAGMNAVMIWSYIGTNASIQQADERLGYDAPEIWPWAGSPDRKDFDLTRLNEVYFQRLRAFVDYARHKDLVVIITVQDGWTKTRFAGHPFNAALGNGPLADKGELVELADYEREMPEKLDPQWDWRQRNQYFQERYAEKMIQALKGCDNVLYELFNEGEWYEPEARAKHERHFVRFFKSRTRQPVLSNVDHIRAGGFDAHGPGTCDVVALHGAWTGDAERYRQGLARVPVKPYLLSEPVPEWRGEEQLLTALRHSVWEKLMSGAGWMNQNDASFGWDPRSRMAGKMAACRAAYRQTGVAARLVNDPTLALAQMRPTAMASTGLSLAWPGHDYVVYAPKGGDVALDLREVQGPVALTFHDPRTGQVIDGGTLAGGRTTAFTCPDQRDWVLRCRATEPAIIK